MIIVHAARGEVCPHRLRIYSNLPHGIDFEQAEDTKPHLDISLLEDENGVTEYPLRVAAFTNVNSLTLFFVRGLLAPAGGFMNLTPSTRPMFPFRYSRNHSILCVPDPYSSV